jgi:C4-dicarboxylate-specific signal transduction histidine kinase
MTLKTRNQNDIATGNTVSAEVPSGGERTPPDRRLVPAIFSIGLGVAVVAAAWAVTVLSKNVISTSGFVFFYTAVIAGTWYGGRWGGTVSVILATLTVDYFFMPPLHSLQVNRNSLPVFVEFAASSAVVGWFSSWRKQAESALRHARDELQTRVEERTAELRHTNEQLRAEMAERKRAEEAYYEAQAELARVTRISALGALAASISHEVNQPLAAVVTNADACAMWLGQDPPDLNEARAAVDAIAREGTRASDVIRRIRAMFSKSAAERSAVEVNDMLREAAALMEPEAQRNQVSVRLDLANGLRLAWGDRIQLQQVVVNLILNGIEAMHDTENRPRRLVVRSELYSPDEVLVAVRDDGVGIEPKDHRRIFEAFFTTKPQGMGMGLNISHSVVEAHGGRLWAAANDDFGTTFQFTIPVIRDGEV